jgi:hypothetical protein
MRCMKAGYLRQWNRLKGRQEAWQLREQRSMSWRRTCAPLIDPLPGADAAACRDPTTATLDKMAESRGSPEFVRCDDWRDFTAKARRDRCR